MRRVVIAAVVLVLVVIARASSQEQIPSGPSVRVSDGWYHLEDCSIAVGRQAPSMALADALRKGNGPCPICEPLAHQPEWATFVKTHGDAIKAEVKARAEFDAAEAKRKKEAEEADRLRRLAELEAERKRRETAPVVRLTEAQAREIAQTSAAEAGGDPAAFQTKFRAHVKEVAPEYAGPQIVYGSSSLRIVAFGPLAKFEASVAERLQRRLPAAGTPWATDVTIAVIPESVDAPDIKQIVVQRSDALRPAGAETTATVLSTSLGPRRMPGAPSAAKAVTAGDVVFPLSAFEPGDGVLVRVIAVPSSGANLSKIFQGMALRLIQ